MPNSFNVGTKVALVAADHLRNRLKASGYFNWDRSKEFDGDMPTGDSIRVEYPDPGTIRNGLIYNPEAISPRYGTITYDDPFGVDFELDSVEKSLSSPRGMDRFEEKIIAPKMAQLAQEIDSRLLLYAYQNAASVVGALGTNPSSYDATSGAARQKMVERAGIQDGYDNGIFLPPAVHRAIRTANIALHNPSAAITKQHRTGRIEYADGFDFHESMSLYRHTAGTWASAVTVTATQTDQGITSMGITGTSGDTIKKGDKIGIAGVLPVNRATRRTFGTDTMVVTATADVTFSGSTATLSFSPALYGPGSKHQNVDSLPAASAALTLWPGTTSPNGKVGVVGIAFNKLAFAAVSRKLDEPKNLQLVGQKRDPDSGIYIRVIRDWDSRASKWINRFDCWLGYGSFYNAEAAVAIPCA